jgi:hypothetical protein
MAQVSILVNVCLIKIDQEMPIVLGTGEQPLELLDKGLPPLRISPAEQLLGFLPRQLEAVQGGADRLAADAEAEALTHPADQALEGPARSRIGALYGRSSGAVLGGAHELAETGLDVGTKGGRPPVRR